jgi:hypothetical protein
VEGVQDRVGFRRCRGEIRGVVGDDQPRVRSQAGKGFEKRRRRIGNH